MTQPETGSKFTKEQYQSLMEMHGIDFEGRILPELWGEYTEFFQEIRAIGEIRREKYIESFAKDDDYIVDKLVRANNLTKAAWHCLQVGASEYGWRKDIEFAAFKRFDTELVCHICLKRRWKPKLEAKPIDPAEAERLRRRRRKRLLCTCTRLQRANISADDHCSPIFSGQLDKIFDHEDVTEEVKKQLGTQRPDMLIGLGLTQTLKHYLPSLQTRYSPFRKPNVVYPFIVTEAKTAESSSASFGSMLRQTAFVIRTCLRLQQNLQRETGVQHQCLVWSFAIMGEEWRLYAAVPNGPRVQIFDLWHGTVLFPEGAFQLLLIVDYLCDWACEVYRMSILACLTGGRTILSGSRLTPSGTEASSQVSDADIIEIRAASLPRRPSLVPEPRSSATAVRRSNEPPQFLDTEPMAQFKLKTLMEREDAYNWQRWLSNDQNLQPWTQMATIRHSNQVELRFLQVTMPEETQLLDNCLKLCFPDLLVKDAAKSLLLSMHDDDIAVTISINIALRPGNQQSRSISAIRAMVYFRSELNLEDWQVTRQLLCFLCSEKAMERLAQLAEVPPSIGRYSTTGYDARRTLFLQAITWPILIRGTQSAGLALMRPKLCLKAVTDITGSSSFEWTRFSPQRDGGITADQLGRAISHALERRGGPEEQTLAPYMEKHRFRYIVPVEHDMQQPPDIIFETPNFQSQGIFIKKGSDGWPQSTQRFCFLVMNENVHFDDDAKLGQLLEEARSAGEIFGVVRNNLRYGHSDKALLDRWIKIARGQLPQDTQLE